MVAFQLDDWLWLQWVPAPAPRGSLASLSDEPCGVVQT